MSVKNLVQCPLITPVSSTATELLLGAVSAPYSLPPLDGGILVISDSPSKPSFVEFIKYTHRIDNVLYGVSRGQEETAARNWSGVTFVYQALTADQYTSELASKEPVIPPGTTAQYWRGDKSFQDLATAIRAANLTGFSTATNSPVVSTDTLLAALGKLQAQVSARLLSTANAVSATKLQTARTISVAGDATGSLTFDGTANVSMDVSLQPSGVSAGTFTKVTVDSKGRVTAGTSLVAADIPTLNQSTTGNAATATKLATARTLSITGDATGSLSFDGSANASAALTLASSGVAAGTYKSLTVDAKGRVTAGADVVTGLVTASAATGTANEATTNTNTFLNITEKVGTAVASAGTSTQIQGAGSVTVASDTAGKITITGAQSITGNAATATKLATARTLTVSGAAEGSVAFDGSANVSIATTTPRVSPSVDPTSTFRAAIFGASTDMVKVVRTATAGFENLPQYGPCLAWSTSDTHAFFSPSYSTPKIRVGAGSGTNIAWAKDLAFTDSDITGNAATATKLATARTINGVAFDGTANITLPSSDGTPAGAVMTFARSTPPAGWLKANGVAVSRTTYADLFAAIGTTFGTGNGSTTFNLPDLRGEFLRGWDDARGVDAGRAFGSWQDSDNKSHGHGTSTTSSDSHTHTFSATTSTTGAHNHTQGLLTSSGYDTRNGAVSTSGSKGYTANGNTTSSSAPYTSTDGNHTHTVSGTTSADSHTHTLTVAASGGAEARPRNVALLVCIKY